jgi:hypothetical protein
MLDGRHEARFLMDEMIRRQKDDYGFGVASVGVEERQQDAGTGLTITRLDDQHLQGAIVQVLLGIAEVWVCDDDEEMVRWDEPFRTSQCVVQHRVVVNEGAVLLGAVDAEASVDEGLQPSPLAPGQDNAPQVLPQAVVRLPLFRHRMVYSSAQSGSFHQSALLSCHGWLLPPREYRSNSV